MSNFIRTNGGCIKNKEDVTVVTAPTLMWVKALDILMDKLLVEGVDFSKIAAISGSAQVRYFFFPWNLQAAIFCV